ncbi:MAG: hypothetical protein HY718_21545, partial [Planctomycetes bacterium]|nr:hypothetical protein [Planctomycetota bacterium]
HELARSIDTAVNGEILIAGEYVGAPLLGAQEPFQTALPSAGTYAPFIAKLTP